MRHQFISEEQFKVIEQRVRGKGSQQVTPAVGPPAKSTALSPYKSNAGYSALHKRVKAKRGTPSLCEHCNTTTAKRYEWANLTGQYGDVYDYIRLCTSCHRKHDGHSRGFKSGLWKGGPPITRCRHCGIIFSRHKQNNGRMPRFCSLACCNEWQRNGRIYS